ncbi:MAG: CPXCG motif-containing cysteine-rich protein [Planctomycetaceae bacterium]
MSPEVEYVCEACGEVIVIPVDPSAGRRQQYVEDCPVCCRPNVIRVVLDHFGNVEAECEPE